MAKKVKESRRIIVGWGKKDGRRCFFIAHGELPETLGDPICCQPEDLPKKMMEVADRVDKIRGTKPKYLCGSCKAPLKQTGRNTYDFVCGCRSRTVELMFKKKD